jgi:RNA polymerase sigma-70 factor (sigma-E family)
MRLISMGPNSPPVPSSDRLAASAATADAGGSADDAAAAVTAIYQANALGLVRLAHVMVSDVGLAEDIVQDAFGGLYRRWGHLSDQSKALAYVRSAVLNSCRSALRRKQPVMRGDLAIDERGQPSVHTSGEAAALAEDERRIVMAALRKLPDRQREVLVLRFYLDMSEAQIAAEMGIGQSTVRSAAHRAFTKLGRMLEESP